MNEYLMLLLARAAVLMVGAAICWLGGGRTILMNKKLPKSEISKFVWIMAQSVILLGLTMLLIAVGNLLVYYLNTDWAYLFLVSAGLVGIASIATFLYGFREIYKYVVVK